VTSQLTARSQKQSASAYVIAGKAPQPQARGGDGADPSSVSNAHLLRWMFQFIRPVIWLVAPACLWVAVSAATETLSIRQAG